MFKHLKKLTIKLFIIIKFSGGSQQQSQPQNNVTNMQATAVSTSSVLPGGHPGPLLS